ncbi:MAG: hypothetical protein IT324_10460 [Anaerolineae bacterium]|nr:hypothetical protein [Anaerolineae bacterium]
MLRQYRLLLFSLAIGLIGGLMGVTLVNVPLSLAQAPTGDVARGKYLVEIGACADCHGAPKLAVGKDLPLAGGNEFPLGPLGTYYATNLTTLQDWTYQDFDKALRQGIEPKTGRVLAPIMPYLAYHGMSDSDVASVGAYLKSLKPVRNNIPDAKPGPAAAQALQPLPAVSVPTLKIDDSADYGRYLVENVSACGDCHSPRDPSGQFIKGKELAGGGINLSSPDAPVFAPPILGSVLNAQGFTKETFVIAIRSGVYPWGAQLSPLMPWRHYSNMTESDATAIWNFLQTKKLDAPWPVPAAGTAAATAQATQAK